MIETPATGKPYPGVDTTLGFIFDAVTPEQVTGSFKVGPEHLQPVGIVHGGIYATFAESAASLGSYFAVVDSGKTAAGMSNATTLMRPVSEGSVHCVAKPIHRGRTTWVWDIEMTNDDGKLCAVSRLTIAIRDAS
jgi:uncharacterized protein (TIGR00369 family)